MGTSPDLLTGHISALGTGPGVFQGILIGGARQGHPADAGINSGSIHHLKHMRQPFACLPAQVSRHNHRLAPNVSAQVGEACSPSLSSTAVQTTSFGLPIEPSGFTFILGTIKSDIPLIPLGGTVDAGDHQMDDIFGQIMVAPGNKYFGPLYFVMFHPPERPWSATPPDWNRHRARSGTWCPPQVPSNILGINCSFLFYGSEAFNQMRGTVAETGSHVKGLAGPVHHIIDDNTHHVGKTLPAVFLISGRSRPAVLPVLFEHLAKFGRTGDPGRLPT